MKYLELPTSVSDVRSSLQELERGCPRSDMLELLKISSNPSLSTLDDPDSFLLIESWQLESSYKLTILYDRVDENIFFRQGLITTQLAGRLGLRQPTILINFRPELGHLMGQVRVPK